MSYLLMQVFLYQGTLKCYSFPFVIMLVTGSILIIALVIALPLYALYIIYRPAVQLCVYVCVSLSLSLYNLSVPLRK